MKILVINGPNINMLGMREPSVYGNDSYVDLLDYIQNVAAEEGVSVTFISSEVEEMLRTCSRLIVMRDRHAVGELTGKDLNQTQVMKTIAGGES